MPVVNPMDLSGRHVLVTGASSGIGRATAVLLSRLGARVTLTGRDADRLQQTVEIMAGDGHRAAPFDLGAIDEIPAWLRDCAQVGGPLSGLAHCAGVQVSKPIRNADAAFMSDMFRINIASGLALARAFRQRGSAVEGAGIVFVASASAFVGQAGNVVYCATKGAVVSAARALAVELARDRIRVNCVCPALVDTEMADRFRSTMSEAQFEEYLQHYPMGIGRPEDVANAIAFLIADTARWMTGTSLLLDGGLLAG
ncbi:oxidoreductase [Aliidongia dinghuensis]|uniref:Oxidoreductase n=1 Tax=Aliidongia dinghuensis TaxID=1867774 RepID=A0A8J3E2S9_9PROT|nr:SDR family oxidoreductase [Aliidongia dinghuensis]GGF24071.1 oxidoreductase [Aliidongia dinghuensis]